MPRYAIGVDLGGTDIKAGVVDSTGRIVSRVKRPTQAAQGRAAVIANLAAAADHARSEAGLAWSRIAALGLGSPGVFDNHGRVHHCANIACLQNRPLLAPVLKALAVPALTATLDNDANMAAYAESWVGAGRGHDSLVLFTLGTGIGGGIVLHGEVWRGAWGAAAELGHQILHPDAPDYGSGTAGSLEDVASATGLVRRFREAVQAGRSSPLAERVRRGEPVTARDISVAARAGDALCRGLIEETGRALGIAVTNMLHILNVELVVFAGGMTADGPLLLKPIRDEARRRTFPFAFKGVRILFSKLGNDAGLIGAAGWALHAHAARRGGPR